MCMCVSIHTYKCMYTYIHACELYVVHLYHRKYTDTNVLICLYTRELYLLQCMYISVQTHITYGILGDTHMCVLCYSEPSSRLCSTDTTPTEHLF